MQPDTFQTRRRSALLNIGLTVASLATAFTQRNANAAQADEAEPASTGSGATHLRGLHAKLAAIPRRRNFTTVPFMVTDASLWDKQAADEVLAYRYRARQVWENSDIDAAWPSLMRETISGQTFGLGHPDFLAVSATHGFAHLALFKQAAWDRYDLASLAGPKFPTNTLIVEKAGVSPSDSHEDVNGYYGPANSNIVSLQQRGAVFIACHDSIHAVSRMVAASHPDKGDADRIAADLTNNLIDDAILVPSVVAFLVELQHRGFTYAKGS